MALLVPQRHSSDRLERLATRPALVSTHSVARVSRFDGRTRVVAVRTAAGWQRPRHIRWTRENVDRLRGTVREVLLARHFRRARVPLAWIPTERQQ